MLMALVVNNKLANKPASKRDGLNQEQLNDEAIKQYM